MAEALLQHALERLATAEAHFVKIQATAEAHVAKARQDAEEIVARAEAEAAHAVAAAKMPLAALTTAVSLVETGSAASLPWNRAFAIPELQEAIFLHLPNRDLLLRLPLVCKEWRDGIKSSPKLQQALFFRPLPGRPLHFLCTGNSGTWAEHANDQHCYTLHRNPFFNSLCHIGDPSSNDLIALTRPEASWRSMLVCQPPTTRASRHESSALGHVHEAADHLGLRFSDLIRARCAGFFGHALNLTSCKIHGQVHWKDVQVARDVRRIVRPKPSWLSPATASAGQG